jgi:hypothetical protein
MPLLFHWVRQNYDADRQRGFEPHLNQNSPKMRRAVPGEHMWAFTRYEDSYVLAAVGEIVRWTKNKAGNRYGRYRVWLRPGTLKYFDIEQRPQDATRLIGSLPSLEGRVRHKILGCSFQGPAGVRVIDEVDDRMLSEFAQDLPCLRLGQSDSSELPKDLANDLEESGPVGISTPRQPDPLLRQRVEQIAVETTTAHFTHLGYRVESVENDNVGWDLNAVLGKQDLKLEVKGLSGSQTVVELTPNEFAAMGEHRKSYRVCVVTTALTKPCLEIFAYSPDSRQWKSSKRRVLHIEKIIAARCSSS